MPWTSVRWADSLSALYRLKALSVATGSLFISANVDDLAAELQMIRQWTSAQPPSLHEINITYGREERATSFWDKVDDEWTRTLCLTGDRLAEAREQFRAVRGSFYWGTQRRI